MATQEQIAEARAWVLASDELRREGDRIAEVVCRLLDSEEGVGCHVWFVGGRQAECLVDLDDGSLVYFISPEGVDWGPAPTETHQARWPRARPPSEHCGAQLSAMGVVSATSRCPCRRLRHVSECA
jgi:hypothetical protein